jgi:RNA polymerase sigma factor (sigma-70 family)
MSIERWKPQVEKALSLFGKTGFGQDKVDLRQKCYLALILAEQKIKDIRKLRGDDAAGGYAFVVCKNTLLGEIRTGSKMRMSPYVEKDEPEQTYEQLDDAVASLPAEEQTLIHQVYYEGRSAREIARMNGTNRRTVQKKKERILKKLGVLLNASQG